MDASDISAGGVLFHYDKDNKPTVLGYHSKTLKKSQKNWKVTEKEMFAIKVCCEKWHVYCNGKVVLYISH